MKVLFVTPEAQPFKGSGGLAEVAGALPRAVTRRFVGCRVVMPLYHTIAQAHKDSMTFLFQVCVPVAWRRQYCGVFRAKVGEVIYYFLDNEYYFKRDDPIYGHYDDAERFTFFSRAVLEILPLLDYAPDILHCNDWHTALVPVYLAAKYRADPRYAGIKTIQTIHNLAYQGIYNPFLLGDIFDLGSADEPLLRQGTDLNLLKGGIACADAVTTVSPSYAAEILTPEGGEGLDSLLRDRQSVLSGILNGIDDEVYDPATDPCIPQKYSVANLSGKVVNKATLQAEFALHPAPDAPLFGMVTRLAMQKGLDLLIGSLERFLHEAPHAQLICLGGGETRYEIFLHRLHETFPGRVGVDFVYQAQTAHRVYAGIDIYLMPSLFEPCGLGQLYALRYGAVPLVRETGGLKNTIKDSGGGDGNGFTFYDPTPEALRVTMHRAIQGYADADGWRQLTARAMRCDHSWTRSAGDYIRLYRALSGKR
jgi:starch synthase